MIVNIYTYTDLKFNKDGSGHFCYAIEAPGHPEKTVTEIVPIDGTQATAELAALINALDRFEAPCDHLMLYGQCSTVMAALSNNWIEKWHDSGWVNSKGEPIRYPTLYKILYDKLKDHKIVGVQCGRHTFTGWFENEIKGKASGHKTDIVAVLNSCRDQISRALEDAGDVSDNEQFKEAAYQVINTLLEKTEPKEGLNTGFVKIENPPA